MVRVTALFNNSAAYLQQRHNIPPELLQNIAVVEALATKGCGILNNSLPLEGTCLHMDLG